MLFVQDGGERPGHRRMQSDTQFFTAAESAGHARRPSDVPLGSPPTNQSKTYAVLRLPVLSHDQPGRLPAICTFHSKHSETPGSRPQTGDRSRLNVEVRALGDISATLSPPCTRIIAR